MRLYRIIFYFFTLLTIGEVTSILTQWRQAETFYLTSEWMESPLEEDESKEYEDSDDFFCGINTAFPGAVISAPARTPSLDFDLAEPLHEIVIPPPQG